MNYGIIWERSYWDIRCSSWQAYFNGPEQKGTWTLTISGKKSLMYATMHRALLIAFYGTWGGLCKPTASHKHINKSTYFNSSSNSNTLLNSMSMTVKAISPTHVINKTSQLDSIIIE